MRRGVWLFLFNLKCFNPRICKRCDPIRKLRLAFRGVSIHASVKDATAFVKGSYATIKVSIHASVKDATGVAFKGIA